MDNLATQWKRDERRRLWGRILRLGFGIPLLLFSYPHLGLFSPFLLLLGAILVAPDIAGYLSRSAGSIIWPHHEGKREPLYGIPESLAISGKYAEAEREYDKIIAEFPEELKPHIDMINIAVTRLNDGELAAKLYERGMNTLKDPAAQEKLTEMYKAIATRLKPPPRPQTGTAPAPPKGDRDTPRQTSA